MIWIIWAGFSLFVLWLGIRRGRQAGDRCRRDIDQMMRTTVALDREKGRPLTYPGIGP